MTVCGQGDDVLTAGRGDDWLYGGYGNDIMEGGDGHDRLDGSYGNDIWGGFRDDILDGGSAKMHHFWQWHYPVSLADDKDGVARIQAMALMIDLNIENVTTGDGNDTIEVMP